MAKREIPEINAGSMADIAFLLLIFFLVTTTMEKDTAYIRQIPKIIENPPPAPPLEPRNICEIRANNQNQLLFRKEAVEDPSKISEKIVEWYRMNENLSESQMSQKIKDNGYEGYNFPFYSYVTKEVIQENIDRQYDLADQAEAVENYEIMKFHMDAVNEWQGKMRAIKLLGKSVLKEIHPQAHIRVEVQQKTEYELFATIQSEIQEALFELRDEAAKEIFQESYATIKKRYENDKADKKGDKKKLELLEILYPGRIIEVKPKR